MNAKSSILFIGAAVAVGVIVHCGGSTPTQPPPTTVPTQPVTTTTTLASNSGIVLPPGMVCSPTPPPLYGIQVAVWDKTNPNRLLLDTKPLVMNVDNYCANNVGVSGRFCDTRLEGDPQRVACDWLAVGKATDTGNWGPTWSFNGNPCAPPGSGGDYDCINHTEQFKVIAKASGRYEACAAPNARVDPVEGGRCGGVTVGIPYY